MSEFKIGDKVRIVGPSTAMYEFIGVEFTIDETRFACTGEMVYSSSKWINGMGLPWYPASSLVLVRDEEIYRLDAIEGAIELIKEWMDLQMGINKDVNKAIEKIVKCLENDDRPNCLDITKKQMCDVVSNKSEMRVGDWVEVICNWPGKKIFKIHAIHEWGISDREGSYHSHVFLRRLSDEEIARRLNA